MKTFKLLLFLLCFFAAGIAFASTSPDNQSSTLATVNIENAKIVSQDGNNLKISFTLTNREGLQTGVKYAVMLVSEVGQKQFVVDEKVFDESLTLPQNSTLEKEVTYTATNVPGGTYTVLVKSSNANGFPFGIAEAGTADITGELSLQIINETCGIDLTGKNLKPITLLKGMDIDQNQSIYLNCSAKNNTNQDIAVTPEYVTNYRSEFGEEVEAIGGDTKPIIFAPLEKKSFSLALPKVTASQVYNVSMVLKNPDITSNTVSTHYFVHGKNITIVNLSFDKDYYKKGETANLALVLSSSITTDTNLNISITNNSSKDCIAPFDKTLSSGSITPRIDIPVMITNDCLDPNAVVKILDSNGNILDQKDFSVKTTSAVPSSSKNKNILLTALVILVFIIIFFLIKKRNKNTPGPSLSVLIFIFGLSLSLIPSNFVKADTFAIGANNDIFVTASLNKSNYAPGENIIVTGISIYSGSANADSVSLQATTAGNPLLTLISTTGIYQGTTVYGNNVTLVAPSSSGAVNFTAGIDQPTNSFLSGGVSSQPALGGTNDTQIVCSASISPASINGDQVAFKYVYTFNGGSPVNGSCNLSVPVGQSTVTDDPGFQVSGPYGTGVNIVSFCFDKSSSTVLNNAGVTNCP